MLSTWYRFLLFKPPHDPNSSIQPVSLGFIGSIILPCPGSPHWQQWHQQWYQTAWICDYLKHPLWSPSVPSPFLLLPLFNYHNHHHILNKDRMWAGNAKSHALTTTPLTWQLQADQLIWCYFIFLSLLCTLSPRDTALIVPHTCHTWDQTELLVAMKAMNHWAWAQPTNITSHPCSHYVTRRQGLLSGACAQVLVAGVNRFTMNDHWDCSQVSPYK